MAGRSNAVVTTYHQKTVSPQPLSIARPVQERGECRQEYMDVMWFEPTTAPAVVSRPFLSPQ
jgi:hypothetical protein